MSIVIGIAYIQYRDLVLSRQVHRFYDGSIEKQIRDRTQVPNTDSGHRLRTQNQNTDTRKEGGVQHEHNRNSGTLLHRKK